MLAVLGAARWPALLAAGWAGHALWDLLLHAGSPSSYAPDWYPGACAGFDLVIGAYLAWGLLARRRHPGGPGTTGTRDK